MANVIQFDDLFTEYKRLVKVANERLRQLELRGMTEGSAYKAGVRRAQSAGAQGKRFSAARPKSVKALRARLNAVREFTEMKTSTATGYKSVGKNISNTLKERYGVHIPKSKIGSVFNSTLWKKLENQYGSGTAIQLLASIQKGGANTGRVAQSAGGKRLLSKGELQLFKDELNTWISADDKELKEIQGYFKG